jgi:adenine phosphoribosyltransferase
MRQALIDRFRWRSDPPALDETTSFYADDSAWWRSSQVIAAVGRALAELFPEAEPTVVMGTESRGTLLAALVAQHLRVGVAEVRKGAERASDDDIWLVRRTPPDYRDRHLDLAVRRSVLRGGDRVLFVDDWIATGGQAVACQQLVADASAEWLGAAVVVDGMTRSPDRRSLAVRSLLHIRDLR